MNYRQYYWEINEWSINQMVHRLRNVTARVRVRATGRRRRTRRHRRATTALGHRNRFLFYRVFYFLFYWISSIHLLNGKADLFRSFWVAAKEVLFTFFPKFWSFQVRRNVKLTCRRKLIFNKNCNNTKKTSQVVEPVTHTVRANLVLPGFTEFYWVLPSFTGF